MTKFLDIKADELIDFTLKLQKINDVALPIAVQNTLNTVVKQVKFKYLAQTTNKMFDIKKRTFFKANSGFTKHKAKEFGYKVSRLNAQIGITKSNKSHEKATEQVGNQQTSTNIRRSINPLSEKPVSKNVIDVLSKKPLIYDSSINYSNVEKRKVYLSRLFQAQRQGRGLIMSNGRKGAMYKINSITKRKNPTKKNPNQFKINRVKIASYIKDGEVKLKTKKPFLNAATEISMDEVLHKAFMAEAKRQFERVMKK